MLKRTVWYACLLGLGVLSARAESDMQRVDPTDIMRNPLEDDEYLMQVIKQAREIQRDNPLDLLNVENEEQMLFELNDALKNIAAFINTPEAAAITQSIYNEMSQALDKIKQIQERTGVATLDQALERANSYKSMRQPERTE